jgi:hypothetical protein
MTAEERLALVWLKIERADKHIADVKAAVQAFYDTIPYETTIKPNLEEPGKLAWYVTRAEPVPPEVATIAGDALHNLRSALDYLAQQLYLVSSPGNADYQDKTSFLIASSDEYFKNGIPGKLKGMRQDAIDAICALEPYKGGRGNDLWVLHRLDNIDKHRLIVTVGSDFRSMNLGPRIARTFNQISDKFKMPDFDFFVRPANRMLKPGMILAGATEDEVSDKPPFRLEVAVNEPGVIEGQSLIEMVDQFRNRVARIVTDFKPYLA